MTCQCCHLDQPLPNWPERHARYTSLLASLVCQVNEPTTQQPGNRTPPEYDDDALEAEGTHLVLANTSCPTFNTPLLTGRVTVKLLSGLDRRIPFHGAQSAMAFIEAAAAALGKEPKKLRLYLRNGTEIQASSCEHGSVSRLDLTMLVLAFYGDTDSCV